MIPDFAAVERAAERIAPYIASTPVLHSNSIDELAVRNCILNARTSSASARSSFAARAMRCGRWMRTWHSAA